MVGATVGPTGSFTSFGETFHFDLIREFHLRVFQLLLLAYAAVFARS